MTTTHSGPPTATDRDAPPRPVRRALLTTLAAIGPVAVGGALLALPYSAAAAPTDIAAAAVASPAAMGAAVWLDLLAALTLVAGAVVVGRVAVRSDPRWGTPGAILAVGGFAAMAVGVFPPDLVAEAAARTGGSPTATAALLTAMAGHPAAALAVVLFLAGHVLGLILVGVALVRGRAVPRWAAIALIVSAPLHLVFTAIVDVPVLAALSWVLTAVGMARAAAR